MISAWQGLQQVGLAAALACLVAACPSTEQTTCANGLVCPASTVCAPSGDEFQCVNHGQVIACEGREEGDVCTFPGASAGHCLDGVCVVAACGDGVLDPNETCDDGNRQSGDGCRADCQKIEVCGDAIFDEGESCDDGNQNPVDGCDACVATEWRASPLLGSAVGAATSVNLNRPKAVAVDSFGNLYISDTDNHRIRRVDVNSGAITTVAGDGTPGAEGDGGASASGRLRFASGLAIDGLGNIFVADTSNHKIRRIDGSTGIITTIAGTGLFGYNDDGLAAVSSYVNRPLDVCVDGFGNVYIADTGNHRVRRIDANTGRMSTVAGNGVPGDLGDGGAATSAQLDDPVNIAVDAVGNIYIADENNHKIRRVDVSTGLIATVVGTGVAGGDGDGGAGTAALLNQPRSVDLDDSGNLYIADFGNDRIRRLDGANGIITTVAGVGTSGFSGDGGLASAAQLHDPTGVAVDAQGNLYVADRLNQRIRRVEASTQVIATVAGTGVTGFVGDGGEATGALLSVPTDITFDAQGNLYIADAGGDIIRRVSATTGLITTVAGTGSQGLSGDGGAATSAQIDSPAGIALDSLGNLVIADSLNHKVRRVDMVTGIITSVAGTGTPGFNIADEGGPAINAQLDTPRDVLVDSAGNILIADTRNQRIRRVDATTGVITTIAGNGIFGYDADDEGAAATSARLATPYSIAFDTLENLYIADSANHRIRRVDTNSGAIITIAGNGGVGYRPEDDGGPATSAQLTGPRAVVVDGLGNVFVSDTAVGRVRRIDGGTGVITTVSGIAGSLAVGEGGPAIDADLQSPSGLVFDTFGNLLIADGLNGFVRRIDAISGIITTVAGEIDPEGMGAVARAKLANPIALGFSTTDTFFAGGASGRLQVLRGEANRVEVVAGRYPQDEPTLDLARFRDKNFGDIKGVAVDAARGLIYVSEAWKPELDPSLEKHRIHVITIVDPDDEATWTIEILAGDGLGFAEGDAASARFRNPSGLFLDKNTETLYVADSGNHVIRTIDVSVGAGSATVSTFAGTPTTLGFFGDEGSALGALLFKPSALTRCPNGDFFVSDAGNHRVRRIQASTQTITTVLGDGVGASSGEGTPANTFPVNQPLGLACDALGNLFVTSTRSVRLLPADASGMIDGLGAVQTIHRGSLGQQFSDIASVDSETIWVTEATNGQLLELLRQPESSGN